MRLFKIIYSFINVSFSLSQSILHNCICQAGVTEPFSRMDHRLSIVPYRHFKDSSHTFVVEDESVIDCTCNECRIWSETSSVCSSRVEPGKKRRSTIRHNPMHSLHAKVLCPETKGCIMVSFKATTSLETRSFSSAP